MNRRELYRQMRAAELGPLPPVVDGIGMVGLLLRLARSLSGVALRVGVVFGLVLGTLVCAATVLVDAAVGTAPAALLQIWVVLCVSYIALSVGTALVGVVVTIVGAFIRGQLWHRRYSAAALGGFVAAAAGLAVGLAAWWHSGERLGAEYRASGLYLVVLAAVVAVSLWIGRCVQLVLGLWRSRGLEPPLAPPRRWGRAAWQGGLLLLLGGLAAWDLRADRVPALPAADDRVAERLTVPEDRHVIVLGIDGLGWEDVRAGMGDGSLGTWDRLERSGGRGRLHSATGYGPAAFWITVATGVSAQQHGVRSLVQPRVAGTDRPLALAGEHVGFQQMYGTVLRRAGLSSLMPISRISVRRWCAWEIVRQAGGEAGVVGWWGAWPGAGESGTLDMSALLQGVWLDNEPLAIDVRVGEGLRAVLHRSPRPSLTMAYLPGLDLLARTSGRPVEDARAEAHHRFLDALIGEAATALGPEDLLLVVGDPGGRRVDAPVVGTAREEDGGVMLAVGSGIAPATRISRPRPEDVWPTVAWWLGLPPSADTDGRAWYTLRAGRPPALAVPSYGRPARRGTIDGATAALRLRQLRDAGYIE